MVFPRGLRALALALTFPFLVLPLTLQLLLPFPRLAFPFETCPLGLIGPALGFQTPGALYFVALPLLRAFPAVILVVGRVVIAAAVVAAAPIHVVIARPHHASAGG
jgi:hypothetical protein